MEISPANSPFFTALNKKVPKKWKRCTINVYYVMKLLGHRSIKNTLTYTQLVDSIGEDEEYISKLAKTINEARMLVETGFEYVCDIEGIKLFRKRK